MAVIKHHSPSLTAVKPVAMWGEICGHGGLHISSILFIYFSPSSVVSRGQEMSITERLKDIRREIMIMTLRVASSFFTCSLLLPPSISHLSSWPWLWAPRCRVYQQRSQYRPVLEQDCSHSGVATLKTWLWLGNQKFKYGSIWEQQYFPYPFPFRGCVRWHRFSWIMMSYLEKHT